MRTALRKNTLRASGGLTTFTFGIAGPAQRYLLSPFNGHAQALSAPPQQCGSGPFVRALAALSKLRAYPAGWNGPRSSAADRASFGLAVNFLELLADRSGAAITIDASIFAEGTAVLELVTNGVKMLLEFSADGVIAANIDDPMRDERDLDIEGFDGKSFPSDLEHFFKS